MSRKAIVWNSKDVILREICAEDAEQIVQWRADPEVYRYFKVPRKISVHEHLRWFNEAYCLNKNRVDFIVLNPGQTLVGTVGIIWDEERKTAEVSYLIAPEHRGKGLAAKALCALCSFGKKQWDVSRFIACVHRENLSSRKFIEAQEFTWVKNEGAFRIYQK